MIRRWHVPHAFQAFIDDAMLKLARREAGDTASRPLSRERRAQALQRHHRLRRVISAVKPRVYVHGIYEDSGELRSVERGTHGRLFSKWSQLFEVVDIDTQLAKAIAGRYCCRFPPPRADFFGQQARKSIVASGDSALGPDGLGACVFRATLDVAAPLVADLAQLVGFNASYLVSLPKQVSAGEFGGAPRKS